MSSQTTASSSSSTTVTVARASDDVVLFDQARTLAQAQRATPPVAYSPLKSLYSKQPMPIVPFVSVTSHVASSQAPRVAVPVGGATATE